MEPFKFKIKEVIAIGLEGNSQRPRHTNVTGRVLSGQIALGDLVRVPLKQGLSREAAIKYLLVEFNSPDRFPQMLSADVHGSYTCMLTIRIPPDEAHFIDTTGLITKHL